MSVTLIERACEFCGTRFFALAYEVKRGRGRFCGRKCHSESCRKPPAVCAYCHSPFTPKRSKSRTYCSQKCWRATQTLENAFLRRVDKTAGCWLWVGSKDADGYGTLKRQRKSWRAHRLSYELYCGPIPPEIYVLHRCDNPSCVRPDHLFLGTNDDNMRDMVQKGRQAAGDGHWHALYPERTPCGERQGRAKLTEVDVRAIRAAYARGNVRMLELARDYSVSPSNIGAIVRRDTWRHIS
jgi:hypothetical protein